MALGSEFALLRPLPPSLPQERMLTLAKRFQAQRPASSLGLFNFTAPPTAPKPSETPTHKTQKP